MLALAVVVALAAATGAPGARAETAGDEIPPIVRVAGRGTESGSIEFAIQELGPDGPGGELLFGRSRFMTARLIALQRWRYASPVTISAGLEVRVAARGTESGSVEFAVQARAAGGAWGELLFRGSRFMTPRLIALQRWRYATPVVIRPGTVPPVTARPPDPARPTPARPAPAAPTGLPAKGLPCADCRADPAKLWINFTQGDGVASRNDCLYSARTGRPGLPEGTPVERVASGTGRCEGWSYVTAGAKATWVRNRYLADTPLPYDRSWQPPLPMQFCTIPLAPELGAGFSAEEFLEAVRDAVDTWNELLQGADHELALSGPALDYVGDCEDGERRALRNEIVVTPLRSAGAALRRRHSSGGGEHCYLNRHREWTCTQQPLRQDFEADIFISPTGCGFRSTIKHELGHALGLLHGGQRGDLMYHYFTGCPTSLDPNAVEVAAILEGRASGE